tara:strand:+ start:309 stop:557 length:249 start_codon:yes stop_codon:yes gene_type:complete
LNKQKLKIYWPNKIISNAENGDDWFLIAKKAGMNIPTGCLTGSCGACEIDVNGETIRPCITNIKCHKNPHLNIELTTDPFWD